MPDDPLFPRRLRPTDIPVRIHRPRCAHTVDLPGEPRYLVNVLIEGGVSRADAYALECRDVHTMARTLARANYVASQNRRLLLDDGPPPAPPGYDRRSRTVALVLMSGMAIAVLIMCSAVWRFYQ